MKAAKKKIRENFRQSVFKRDGFKCRACGIKDVKLDAHHITDRKEMPNGGYVAANGISLCDTPGGCHEKAEQFHSSGQALPGYSPDDLYLLIGSSKSKAIEDSESLL